MHHLLLRACCALLLFTFLSACTTTRSSADPSSLPTAKLNLVHRGDPKLAGIVVYRNAPGAPANARPRREHEHPAGILYYFWEGQRVREVQYDLAGQIVRDAWQDRGVPITRTEWQQVDFSVGSDPAFAQHRDPRLP